MKSKPRAKLVVLIATVVFSTLTMWFVYALDDWLGILAFQFQYIALSLFVAVVAALIANWLVKSNGFSALVGVFIIVVALSPYFTSIPSSRILRSVVIDVQNGTPADEVEQKVKTAYADSGYVMPEIARSDTHIYVSLATQEVDDATVAVFNLENGVVVDDGFAPD